MISDVEANVCGSGGVPPPLKGQGYRICSTSGGALPPPERAVGFTLLFEARNRLIIKDLVGVRSPNFLRAAPAKNPVLCTVARNSLRRFWKMCEYDGAVRKVVGIRRGAISDNMRVSFQAA
ncbi:MAG: hypothetical protein K2Z80_00120, partial [Xanthobacteraceae bacterium]|nr:hypothetical protein [Xanthobacteraceae bacterium]